ncbi:hypothetical protein FRC17_010386 [Serendipita sp. 399]|nr:hypothetical protein FRC17_010386 [Serendipita sp. 399]
MNGHELLCGIGSGTNVAPVLATGSDLRRMSISTVPSYKLPSLNPYLKIVFLYHQMDREKNREFPTEILWELFRHALQSPMPKQGAGFFENMDVFAHPCKIYAQVTSTRQSLRLVCRRWNAVLSERHPNEQNGGVLIVDSAFEQEITLENLRFVERFEAIVGWRKNYCRTWPCTPMAERHGPGVPAIKDLKSVRIPPGDMPGRNIKQWKGVEALWIGNIALLMQFDGLPKSLVQEMFNNITNLSLYCTADTMAPKKLHLPRLIYLRLDISLCWNRGDTERFPVELSAPSISTLLLTGAIDNEYIRFIKRLILSTKESLTHLLVSLHLDRLNLQTLGVKLGLLTARFPATCKNLNPPIALVLLGLEEKSEFKRSYRQRWIKSLHAAFLLPSRPFSHIVVPFEWGEIEKFMVQECEAPLKVNRDRLLDKDDPLPCHWSVLQKLAEHGIPIRDRSGVSMQEGNGARFVQRMEGIINDEKYMEERRKAVEEVRLTGNDYYDDDSSDDNEDDNIDNIYDGGEKGDSGWDDDDEDEDDGSMED